MISGSPASNDLGYQARARNSPLPAGESAPDAGARDIVLFVEITFMVLKLCPWQMILPAAFAALAALAAEAQPAPVLAEQALSLKDSVPAITTTGEASAEVVPDIAMISLGIVTERPKAADAARENASAAQVIVNEIKAQGIEAKDIKTVSVTLAPVYDEMRDANGTVSKRTLRGFAAINSLVVRIRDIAKAGALASQLMDKGANRFDGISYDYSQRNEKYAALRGEAARDAKRKAESYVNALDKKLGRVLEIAARRYEPPMPAAMAPRLKAAGPAQDAAIAVPIEPGAETLRTEVEVTFEIEE
jgi:uncharacterized protein